MNYQDLERVKDGPAEATFSTYYRGWLASRGGQLLRTKGRSIKVFATAALALAAARKSIIGLTHKGIRIG